MKKIMLSLLVVGIVAVALGTASIVNAQTPTQQPFFGQGGNGRQGNRVSDDLQVVNEPLHDLMIAAWSTKLGLTVDVLESRIDAGETMAEIAISTGLSIEDFWTLKTEIHTSVAKEALAQGLITQAQADWMSQARQGGGMGGRMGGGNGMRGSGLRGSGLYNGANCPNL